MEQVLNHPFLSQSTADALAMELPAIPRAIKSPIVIFSYQTAQENTLFRMRRLLNAIGVSSFDGLQVPAGRDW